ncbi:hypothetical protein V3851_12655 [Paenibacillus sp. M1]|uniref:Uncharacterized protein n=1 Tax=Paenibacillus haidiansis TaxID=1574488 RepID=A0ABU7VSG8_9BACL
MNKDYPVPKGLYPEAEVVSLIRNTELIDGFGVLDNNTDVTAVEVYADGVCLEDGIS